MGIAPSLFICKQSRPGARRRRRGDSINADLTCGNRSDRYAIMQQRPVILHHLHRHVQHAGDLPHVTLVHQLRARILRGRYETQRGLPVGAALGSAETSDIVMTGVHEFVAERAAALEVRQPVIQDDQPQWLVVESAQSVRQPPLLCICLMVCVPVYRGFVGRVIGEKLTM